MRKTTFAGYTVLDPGEPLTTDGASFLRNGDIADFFARLVKTHKHDDHAPLTDPPDPVDIVADGAGGTLPPDITVSATYTLVDEDGGETLGAPIASATTPAPINPPNAPTLALDTTAGGLVADVYAYLVTLVDALGGETTAGTIARVTRDPGPANAQVVVSGLDVLLTDNPGAVSWRLYRAKGSGDFDLLTTGAGAGFTDDGTTPVDCGVQPPDANSTNGANQVTITLPAGAVPAEATGWRLYATTSGDFTSPSLVGVLRAPATAGAPIVLGSIDVDDGAPPDVSTSIGGSTLIAGGGGGSATPTFILPPFPAAITWPNSLAELQAAGLVWIGQDDYDPSVAIVARRVDIDDTSEDVPYTVFDPATYPFTAADWLGDVAEYTYDATAVTGGVIGTGVVDVDHLLYRDPAAGAAYNDGQWDVTFHIDAAGWERLMVGGVTVGDQNEGFLAIIDRAAGQFQIAHMTAASPLAYTVLSLIALPTLPVTGDEVQINVRRFGDVIYAMPIVNSSLPLASWLTADLSAVPTLTGNPGVFGAWGARWSAANALRLWSQRISSPTTNLELVASTISPTVDGLGNPTWQLDDSSGVLSVLWRSDGTGTGLPDNWQALGNLGTLMNGWDDASSTTAALVQWGRRVVFRGYLANATGWNVAGSVYEMAGGIGPIQDLRFYVGAESSDGTLGVVRLDVLAETLTDPPKIVVGATGLVANAAALDLSSVAWDIA